MLLCSVCLLQIFKSKHSLKMHMSDTHAALAEVSTACEICHKVGDWCARLARFVRWYVIGVQLWLGLSHDMWLWCRIC